MELGSVIPILVLLAIPVFGLLDARREKKSKGEAEEEKRDQEREKERARQFVLRIINETSSAQIRPADRRAAFCKAANRSLLAATFSLSNPVLDLLDDISTNGGVEIGPRKRLSKEEKKEEKELVRLWGEDWVRDGIDRGRASDLSLGDMSGADLIDLKGREGSWVRANLTEFGEFVVDLMGSVERYSEYWSTLDKPERTALLRLVRTLYAEREGPLDAPPSPEATKYGLQLQTLLRANLGLSGGSYPNAGEMDAILVHLKAGS